MSTKKKLLLGSAGTAAAGGSGNLDVDDVFSCHLYRGNDGTQTITNNIDLTKGGLVWTKVREANGWNHGLTDTERGLKELQSNNTSAEKSNSDISSFNSDGFSLTYLTGSGNKTYDIVSWTFRNSNMFQCLKYTGNGVAGRTVAHNLNGPVGMILLKRTDASSGWRVYHRGANGGTNPEQYYAMLQSNNAFAAASTVWNNTAPTSTEFTLGTDTDSNVNGGTYVAYIFAHHPNDGSETGFGSDNDSPVISCGSYTGNGSTTGPEIDLGFEPQWLMIKRTNSTGDFAIFDNMRGIASGGVDGYLIANGNQQEYQIEFLQLLSNGFQPTSTNGNVNASGSTYIYTAIKKGSLFPPTDATSVWATDTRNSTAPNPPTFTSGFPVDFSFYKPPGNSSLPFRVHTRLTWPLALRTDSNAAEASGYDGTYYSYDQNLGVGSYSAAASTTDQTWMWKRAVGYFDCLTFKGNGVDGRTVDHAMLGISPDMIWVKNRGATGDWAVYHKDLNGGVTPEQYYLYLNSANGAAKGDFIWSDTAPTATQFTVGNSSRVNSNNANYIAYLFATVAGVSKISSVVHSGTTTIDAGFSNGSRFILLKRTDASGSWLYFDHLRGIVSGNDPYLELNGSSAQTTNTDFVDPHSSGFTLTSNLTSGTYIYYAIA